MTELYDIEAESLTDGGTICMAAHQGKVLLIVNTASACGLAPQLAELEQLQQTYAKRGFTVLGFPCNQFGNQEPGSHDEIGAFCQKNYGVTFPMHAKVQVNGRDTHPLFRLLKKKKPGLLGTRRIKWNFTKFLVDANGEVVQRFAPRTTPNELRGAIEQLLPR